MKHGLLRSMARGKVTDEVDMSMIHLLEPLSPGLTPRPIFHCPMRDEARILGFTDLMALGYLLYMSVLHELEITIFCSTSCTSLPPLRLSCVRKDLHNLLDSIRCTSERL
jgi:hypothetical protein